MANKRDLKREIDLRMSNLFGECVAATLCGTEQLRDDAEAVMASIVRTHSDLLDRVSHPEPGLPEKEYFKLLRADLDRQAAELADQIGALA